MKPEAKRFTIIFLLFYKSGKSMHFHSILKTEEHSVACTLKSTTGPRKEVHCKLESGLGLVLSGVPNLTIPLFSESRPGKTLEPH